MKFKKNRSATQFRELTFPHMKLLYNVALKQTGNTFDAQDIVQDTYLMAFNKFHQLKDTAKCKSWLLTILRNNFLKSCQKNNSRLRLEQGEYIDYLKDLIRGKDAEALLVRHSGARQVQDAIERLPARYKEVLTLYYMDDLLYKEIAQVLDIPIGTVMSRLTRARESLKAGLLRSIKTSGKTSGKDILNININEDNAQKNGL